MVVNDLIAILRARCVTSDLGLNREIQYVFCCDCKEIVMEKVCQDYAWVNANVDIDSVNLAVDKSISCIIVPYNIQVSKEITEYAIAKELPILITEYTSYKVCSKIYEAFKERT